MTLHLIGSSWELIWHLRERAHTKQNRVTAKLTLFAYTFVFMSAPPMAAAQATKKWPLLLTTNVVHRAGLLDPGIVAQPALVRKSPPDRLFSPEEPDCPLEYTNVPDWRARTGVWSSGLWVTVSSGRALPL